MRKPKDFPAMLEGMKVWRKFGESETVHGRSPEQRAFDSGVFAASELCRRLTKDEDLSGALHQMTTPCGDYECKTPLAWRDA